MRDFSERTQFRPGLVPCQVAFEQTAKPLIEVALAALSHQLGMTLSIHNPAHVGFALEYLAADYLAGMGGYHVDPLVPAKFPGNWATPSPPGQRQRQTQPCLPPEQRIAG